MNELIMEKIIMDEGLEKAIDIIQIRIDYLKKVRDESLLIDKLITELNDDSLLIDMLITELKSLADEIEDLKYYKG